MSKRIGKCKNIDCPNYNEEVEVEFGAEFECPHCHQPLEELGRKPSSGKTSKSVNGGKGKLIGLVVAVIVAIAVVAFLVLQFVEGPKLEKIQLNHTVKVLKVGEKDTLKTRLLPEGVEGDLVWDNSDPGVIEVYKGIVTALKAGTAKVIVKVSGVDNIAAVCEVTVTGNDEEMNEGVLNDADVDSIIKGQKTPDGKPIAKSTEPQTKTVVKEVVKEVVKVVPVEKKVATKSASSSKGINLGYGYYKGETRNGKPHGHGTITYTRSHRIVASKDFVASPGDRFEGDFRDGMVSGGIGYWYHNGDITGIKP